MYNNTVTIFNRSGKESVGFTWFPTVLHGVDLNVDKSANIQRMGTENADSAKLHVGYNPVGLAKTVQGKNYLPPKMWGAQSDEEKKGTITFSDGVDFFMLGEYPEEPINDDGFIAGTKASGFFDYMNKKYDFVFRVTTVGIYELIPHFEIGGA